jgi:undecaprenyl-diphosphatase
LIQPPAADTETKERVERVLEDELSRVDSPQKAEEVLDRAEQMVGGARESDAVEKAERTPSGAASTIERTAARTPESGEPAAVLVETATQGMAAGPEADAVADAARAVAAQPELAATGVPPDVRRGRYLLKEAVLQRMGRFQRVDAQLFIAVNNLPHPPAVDKAANAVTIVTTGGWLYIGTALLAARNDRQRRNWVLREVMPAVVTATWIVERPIKAYFRRKRPFIEIVRALVVGKKPGNWSFPSGHTAAAFASATVISRLWPRWAPAFFSLASVVGFSRVYGGAHYPGDVTAGALIGSVLAEAVRRMSVGLFSLDD